jgi:ABC-type glycerol-3-phosphate transport system substrate-binding protein
MRLTIACASAAAVALLAGSAAAQEVVRFATIFDAAAVERWTPVIEEYERANPGVDIQRDHGRKWRGRLSRRAPHLDGKR